MSRYETLLELAYPWSPSRLLSCISCPCRGYLEITKSLPVEARAPKHPAFRLGTQIHDFLHFLLLGLGSNGRTDVLLDFGDFSTEKWGAVPQQYLEKSYEFVTTTVPKMMQEHGLTVAMSELGMSLDANHRSMRAWDHNGKVLTGKADLILADNKGRMLIIDHKTGEDSIYLTGESVRNQLLVYAYLAYYASPVRLTEIALMAHEVWTGAVHNLTDGNPFCDAGSILGEATDLVDTLVTQAKESLKDITPTPGPSCRVCIARLRCPVAEKE